MTGDPIFFKAVAFLTCLIKGKKLKYYLKNGFTKEDFQSEVKDAIENGLSYSGDKPYDYSTKISNDIDDVIKCLLKEDLISYENNTYYIEIKALDAADFMLDLSTLLTNTGSVYDLFNFSSEPYRKYPGSNLEYGLN
jgi:hypothetical protein